jgi:hypothetical protein
MIIIKHWSTFLGILKANICFKDSFLGEEVLEMHFSSIYIQPPWPVTGTVYLFLFAFLSIFKGQMHLRMLVHELQTV